MHIRNSIFRVLLFTSLLGLSFCPMFVEAKSEIPSQEIQVVIDGVPLDSKVPVIEDNYRLFIPLRIFFEGMGIGIQWNQEEKIIYATKGENEVLLPLLSKTALINGQPIEMDQLPLICKDTTYVPVRFITEAFGGYIEYTAETNTITILTEEITVPVIQELTSVPIYVDNWQYNGSIYPIIKKDVVFVPLKGIFSSMGVKVQWDENKKEVNASKEGILIKLIQDSKQADVNGEIVELEEPMLNYNGNLLIPLRFISETFGAEVYYDSEKEEIHIYTFQEKWEAPFLEKEIRFSSGKAIYVDGIKSDDQRRLMISDNPEILNEDTFPFEKATLWQDIVETKDESMKHRVFGYHTNELEDTINIAITIQNLSTTNSIEILDMKGMPRLSTRKWPLYDVGLKLAEGTLGNMLKDISLETLTIAPGESVMIDYFSIEKDQLIGFIYDFILIKKSGTGDLHYNIRTVATKSDDLDFASIKTESLPLDKTKSHPRGNWPYSTITGQLPKYKTNKESVIYTLSNGKTDNIFCSDNSLGKEYGVIDNVGHFGATYKLEIPIENSEDENKTVQFWLNPRGGTYAGAVMTPDGLFLVPPLNDNTVMSKIYECTLEPGEKENIELQLMHGGGACLPVSLVIETVDKEFY